MSQSNQPVFSPVFADNAPVPHADQDLAPRTAFHKRFDGAVKQLQSIDVTTGVALGTLSTKIDALTVALSQLGGKIGPNVPTEAPLSDGQKICLRALNRVEDVVNDKSPSLADNNKTFKFWRDTSEGKVKPSTPDSLQDDADTLFEQLAQDAKEPDLFKLWDGLTQELLPTDEVLERRRRIYAAFLLRDAVLRSPNLNLPSAASRGDKP